MIITKVELHNIKSYTDRQTFVFSRGINAICGLNGQGKTTILEAIGFALFNYDSGYNHEQILNKHSSVGEIKVNFISDMDEREYTVIRKIPSKTPKDYSVRDSESGFILRQGVSDSVKFLKEQMKFSTDTAIDKIFKDTIGIPQGTLSNDFLLSDEPRKKVFDPILKVSEYDKAWGDLRKTEKVAENKLRKISNEISEIKGELKQTEKLEQEYKTISEELEKQNASFIHISEELKIKEKDFEQLCLLKNEYEKQEKVINKLEKDKEKLEVELNKEKENLSQAQMAREIVNNNISGYEKYLMAEKELELLTEKEKEKNKLEKSKTRADDKTKNLNTNIDKLNKQLNEILTAKKLLKEIEPFVKKEQELKEQIDELKNKAKEIKNTENEINSINNDITAKNKSIEEYKIKIEQIKGLKQRADLLEKYEKELEILTEEKGKKIKQNEFINKLNLNNKQKFDLETEIQELSKEIIELAKYQDSADKLNEYREKEKDADNLISSLKSAIKEATKNAKLLKGGLCPFLNEKCNNIQSQNLEEFFKTSVKEKEENLKEIESNLNEVIELRKQAEAAVKKINIKNERQAKIEPLKKQLKSILDEISNINNEINILQVLFTLEELDKKITEIKELLNDSREAKKQYDKLDEYTKILSDYENEKAVQLNKLELKKNTLTELYKRVEILPELEKEFYKLDKPSEKAQKYRFTIETEPDVLNDLNSNKEELVNLAKTIQQLNEQLKEFINLEQDINNTKKNKQENYKSYEIYQKNIELSKLLEQKQEKVKELEDKLENEKISFQQGIKILNEIKYDNNEYNNLSYNVSSIKQQSASLNSAIKFKSKRKEEMENDLKDLYKKMEEMKLKEKELNLINSVLDFIIFARDVIKKSGPQIVKTLVNKISVQANNIYQELTGRHSETLRWNEDYSIIINRGGEDIEFKSLSGGEQTSAAITVRLALLKETSGINIMFLDEPTTHLDNIRRNSLAQELNNVRGWFNQLFIISHDDSFENITDNIIRVGNN